MRLVDAAVHVLENHSEGRPMHYRRIAEIAVAEGLITPRGLTPEASLNSSLNSDISRRRDLGEVERIVSYGRGYYGIVQHRVGDEIEASVQNHNHRVREQLREALASMDPGDFEDLIGRLLEQLGFEDVEVTARSRDGGIDVRGTLAVGGVTHVRTAIQVKRWSNNVPDRTVRELRGSLSPQERGLIITTSGYTRQAIYEAAIEDRVPVSLVDGTQLVGLLIRHDVGIVKRDLRVLDIDAATLLGETPELPEVEDDATDDAPRTQDTSSRRHEGRHPSGKNLSIWPLPGGGENYAEAAWKMLGFAADAEPVPHEFIDWVIATFERVESRKSARSYIEVLRLAGLVETRGARVVLTPDGAAVLANRNRAELFGVMKANIAGFDEAVDALERGPISANDLLALLNRSLGTEWQTDSQAFWRLQWLVSLGLAERDGVRPGYYRLSRPNGSNETSEVAETS